MRRSPSLRFRLRHRTDCRFRSLDRTRVASQSDSVQRIPQKYFITDFCEVIVGSDGREVPEHPFYADTCAGLASRDYVTPRSFRDLSQRAYTGKS